MTLRENIVSSSAERDDLFALLLAEEGLFSEEGEKAQDVPLVVDGPVALTHAQERIWFLEQLTPGSSTFLIPVAVRLQLPIHVEILETVLHLLWERHQSLRLTFAVDDGVVRQSVGAFTPPPLDVIDLSSYPAAERETRAQKEVLAESKRPFQLAQERLIRTKLLRLQERESIFLLTVHHIIADGWSVDLFLRELVQLYTAKLFGTSANLSALPMQYLDYAVRQQEQRNQPAIRQQIQYWKEKLAGPLATTELPTDFARPLEQTFTGAQQRLLIPNELYRALAKLAQKTGTTMYMLLLAAFKALLQRHVGTDDIILGSPVAGRNYPELEQIVGLFVNTLVLRTDLSGNPSFLTLLEWVRHTCVEAYAHQDVSFEQLLIELLPERNLNRTPLFQIFFNMLRFGGDSRHIDLDVNYLEHPEMNTKFDLTLYVQEMDDQVQLTLVYNTALFLEARMVDFLQQYRLLLQEVVATPDRPLCTLSLVTEYADVVLPNPAAQISDTWEGAIFERLDHWATMLPDKTAVSDPNTTWSYGELSVNSNRLAHFLLAHGVRKGDIVAIHGQRGAALVCAIMGVFKAGAATLILDPAYPDARLQQYLALVEPAGWLTFATGAPPSPAVQEIAAHFAGTCRVALPATAAATQEQLAKYATDPPTITVEADDLACITFTSGSTGKPKGVAGRHGSLTHFYPWMMERFHLTAMDRFSMLSGLAHDPLQRDIFTAIWVGAEIHAPDPVQLGQPGYLPRWLAQQEITIAHLIPSMVHVLTAGQANPILPALRHALFVGEALTRQIITRLRALAPNITVINLYGTSETQRAVSYHIVEQSVLAMARCKQQIPLGVGMPGAQLLVLNEQQQLAGIGELGELYMRSPHLALGYWRDPILTAAKFIPNPLGSGVLYRTGDLGRYLPDGQVEFAGRRDQQVNVRGYRIELAEIEAELGALPSIHSAVVVPTVNMAGQQQLVGYLVATAGHQPNPQLIHDQLRARVPAYMIPSHLIFIDEVPITPNGKITFDALPKVDERQSNDGNYRPPRDDIEVRLTELWQTLLGREHISLDDDFFALGGHSILAIQLFSRLRDQFGVELNIGLLFHYPTLEGLAQAIKNHFSSATAALPTSTGNLICIQQGSPEQPTFFCVHGAGGHIMFMEEWKPYLAGWSIWGFESLYVDGLFDPIMTLEQAASAYIANLQKVQPHGPYLLGGYSGGGVLAYEMAQQLQVQGETVELLVLLDTHHPQIYAEPFRWPKRIGRILRQPIATLRQNIVEKVIYPLTLWYLINRYVKHSRRVPIEERTSLLAHFFVQAKRQYVPKPYTLPTLLVRSQDVIPVYGHASSLLGWDALLDKLYVVEVPGDHFTLVTAPGVEHLANALKSTLEKVAPLQPNQ